MGTAVASRRSPGSPRPCEPALRRLRSAANYRMRPETPGMTAFSLPFAKTRRQSAEKLGDLPVFAPFLGIPSAFGRNAQERPGRCPSGGCQQAGFPGSRQRNGSAVKQNYYLEKSTVSANLAERDRTQTDGHGAAATACGGWQRPCFLLESMSTIRSCPPPHASDVSAASALPRRHALRGLQFGHGTVGRS
jgi:hypothetical protein